MPRRSDTDTASLEQLITRQRGVLTHRQFLAAGMPKSTLMRRISTHGHWQRLLPGVVLTHRGTPTAYERRLGCLAYGGPDSVLTGASALAEHGIRVRSGSEHLLVPHQVQVTSHHFLTVERTRNLPIPLLRRQLRITPVPRAVVDHARRPTSLDEVRAVVAECVQKRRCRPDELIAAVRLAATQRTGNGRLAIDEVSVGLRSVAEMKAREVLQRLSIPTPWWNPQLLTPEGEIIGCPDAYDEVGVALQIDSMTYHLSPADYRRTQLALAAYARHGIVVVSVAPVDVFTQPDQFARTWSDAVGNASLRTPPRVLVIAA